MNSAKMRPDKKADILKHAALVFARYGYAAASISTISSSVGISKSAIYHHFDSKEDIYAEIVIDVLSSMCQAVDQQIQAQTDPETKLRAFMHGHASYFEQHPEMITVTHFGFEGVRKMAKREEITQWRDRYERILRDILHEGQARRSFVASDPSTVGRMVLSILNDMPRWFRPDGQYSATQFADRYCDVILNGIRFHG